MVHNLHISLMGELRVASGESEVALPASKKTRALLGYLVATARPHRRERLCELFWELPDDPKAALRWALSKLRKVVDGPDQIHILAGRERVSFELENVSVDINDIHTQLRSRTNEIDVEQLTEMAHALDQVFLDGLDGAGGEAFDAWLTAEREDAHIARAVVLRLLATHPDIDPVSAAKWTRLWREIDPSATELHSTPADTTAATAPQTAPPPRLSYQSRALRAQRIGFCEVADGTKIAFASIGAGPPLLKAANWLNHLEFDWDSPIWGRSFAAVARGRTFIRYDERGCGLSDWDVDDLNFNAFVEDLEAVADKLELERFPLLGISQGCAVSIEYAVRHPERVSGLILIGGYAAGWKISATEEEKARRDAVRQLTEVGWGTDNPAYRHIFSQTFMPEASAEELAWFDEFQRNTTSPGNAARFQDAFGEIDVRQRLAEVNVPTLVLHSKYDQRIPIDQGRTLAAAIPGAHFLPLESRNHILMDSEPAWRTCIDAVAQFLTEKGI